MMQGMDKYDFDTDTDIFGNPIKSVNYVVPEYSDDIPGYEYDFADPGSSKISKEAYAAKYGLDPSKVTMGQARRDAMGKPGWDFTKYDATPDEYAAGAGLKSDIKQQMAEANKLSKVEARDSDLTNKRSEANAKNSGNMNDQYIADMEAELDADGTLSDKDRDAYKEVLFAQDKVENEAAEQGEEVADNYIADTGNTDYKADADNNYVIDEKEQEAEDTAPEPEVTPPGTEGQEADELDAEPEFEMADTEEGQEVDDMEYMLASDGTLTDEAIQEIADDPNKKQQLMNFMASSDEYDYDDLMTALNSLQA